jgi:CelD/BcsL family acetyltransferase involved in cellulose biosynthesis
MQPDVAVQRTVTVDVINDIDAFSRLRADWDDVLKTSDAACPFLTWEWMHAWWMHLAGRRELHLVVARSGDRVVAIAPLFVSRSSIPWVSRLEFMGLECAGADYLDVICRPGYEQDSLEAIADCVCRRRRSVRLDHVPASTGLARAMSSRLSDGGWMPVESRVGCCPFAVLSGHSWSTYLGSLAVSHQARFRRYLNTLRRKFVVRFDRATDDDGRKEALAALIAFHDDRWGSRGGSTAFQTAALRAFHADVSSRALNAGWLRLSVLRLDDVPAAVTYCFSHNGRFYLYQHGFNRNYRRYSVGLVALGLTIQTAIEEGAVEFDLLFGTEPYKWLWAADAHPLARVDLFPPHAAGRLHRRTLEAERTMRRLARRLFPRKPWDSNNPRTGAGC